MKKLLLALVLALVGMQSAFAGTFPQAQDRTTPFRITQTVYNDSGSSIVSGQVVIYDNDDTEFDRSGYPYVTLTTATDSPWVAGVVVDNAVCADQTLCEIVIQGPAIVMAADATDAFVEDNLVSTSSVSGMAGDWGNGDDTCFLGMAMELRSVDVGFDTGTDAQRLWVYVDPGCN